MSQKLKYQRWTWQPNRKKRVARAGIRAREALVLKLRRPTEY
jgi:ribosomal protein L34